MTPANKISLKKSLIFDEEKYGVFSQQCVKNLWRFPSHMVKVSPGRQMSSVQVINSLLIMSLSAMVMSSLNVASVPMRLKGMHK